MKLSANFFHFPLASGAGAGHCFSVQTALCLRRNNNFLDTQDHPPHGRLDTCLKRCDASWRTLGNLPRTNSVGARPICRLNPATVAGHTVAETWAARLRAMLPRGAREDIPTHRPLERENDCPLNGRMARRPVSASMQNPLRHPKAKGETVSRCGEALIPCAHSGDSGFPFLSHFRSGCAKRVGEPRVCFTFSLGGFLCFLLFLSVLISLWLALVRYFQAKRWQYRCLTSLGMVPAVVLITGFTPYVMA